MIIKKWSGSAWVNQTVRTTASDIFTDNTFTTSIFENGKVKPAYLPNEVFDSLRFFATVGVNSDIRNLGLAAVANAATAGPGGTSRSPIGYYWVATAAVNVGSGTGTITEGGVYASTSGFNVGEESQPGSQLGVNVEVGDWFILTAITGLGTSGSPYSFTYAVVNNTYENATATTHGIVKLFNATPQSTAANTVSTTASRTYGIQNNADGQLVVNVPWVDTNTTYTAGTGLSLTGTTFANTAPDQTVALTGAGATTISGTYPNFTITSANTTYGEASPSSLGLVRTFFNALAGDPTVTETTGATRYYGISANSVGQLVVNVPWVDTNTTYSAGNGISLSSTTFSVAAGVGLTQEATGLKMTQPFISSATAPAASFQVTDNIWFDIA
jgi:hypothetical protein